MENMENWKPVVGYEHLYKVSDKGRVMNVSGKILKSFKDHNGYIKQGLSNKQSKIFFVHRLVAQAFIPNPENKPCVNHLNSDRTDNRIENLEWCTAKENTVHAYNKGRGPIGGSAGNSNLNDALVLKIYYFMSNKVNSTLLARLYNISTGAINSIKLGQTWKHLRLGPILGKGKTITLSKITEIEKLLEEGISIRCIGKQLNTSSLEIRKIKNREYNEYKKILLELKELFPQS